MPPFAYAFERTHESAAAVRALPDGAEHGVTVRVAGRIVSWRGHGKTAFAHLADASGRIQLYFRRDVVGDEAFETITMLDIGDVVGIEGPVFRTRTGEVTIRVESCELLGLGEDELTAWQRSRGGQALGRIEARR